MLLPEFSITSTILNNIATIEYAKAVIENTTILPSWEAQLIKDAYVKNVKANLEDLGIALDVLKVKEAIDELENNNSPEIERLFEAYKKIQEISSQTEIAENDLKGINAILTGDKSSYRNYKVLNKVSSEELLANVVQIFDWHNSLDAKETHPILANAIIKAALEALVPFNKGNTATVDILVNALFTNKGYAFKNFISLADYFQRTKKQYDTLLSNLYVQSLGQDEHQKQPDFTAWLEYYTEALAIETSNIKEKVKLLARDTKIAKATGRAKFSSRQERIVEYLQDYGILQNKDFARVFPDISEDSVLRDLKVLLEKGVVIKSGSTKSSRYELA